jgi:hypothetical protein
MGERRAVRRDDRPTVGSIFQISSNICVLNAEMWTVVSLGPQSSRCNLRAVVVMKAVC